MVSIDDAFERIDRVDFLPDDKKHSSHTDRPISIGFGQTNSQPSTVYAMLAWLDVSEGQRILDVGSGSGWTTALLSELVGKSGWVYAVERIPELLEFGRENCRKIGLENVSFFPATTTFGLPEHGPYDRILVSASADEIPEDLVDQLRDGGKMIVPVGHSVFEVTKKREGDFEAKEHPDFMFVPLLPKGDADVFL